MRKTRGKNLKEIKKKKKIKKKSRGRWGVMATASGGGAVVRPLFVMVGLVERQAMAELTNPRERSTLLCLDLNLGLKFGLCLVAKKV